MTEGEVRARRARGLGNDVEARTGRSYWDIARANLFTTYNNILFVIGVALVALGRYYDAATSVGIGLVNALIGTAQEVRAKRQLDRIALVSAPKVTVVREGRERDVDPAELVVGDVVRIGAGDQVVVDGAMVGIGVLEMDESLLTGEPDLIRKRAGDRLFSGSFCVTGTGYLEADGVGSESFASKLTATARTFAVTKTPLQRKVDLVVRFVMLVVAFFSVIILAAALFEGLPQVRLVQIAAVLSGQVPYGLFLMITVAYALGASAIARQGALVQQVNAVESLSNIDVLCMDKTGTLTANKLVFDGVHPLRGASAEEAAASLGDFARSASASNATADALVAGLPGEKRPIIDEVPFASARKWSALAFDEPERRGVYATGAVEMLAPYLPPEDAAPDSPLAREVRDLSSRGLRVLLFAHNPDVTTLHDERGEPHLPTLQPLAVVSLVDELRPGARETIAAFGELGVELKVISGDDPRTVAALAKRAGFGEDAKLVSGPELEEMSPDEFDRAAGEATVFGRIKPEQKEGLVDALLRRGARVAMMGDGVNDVPALKKASVGIAMNGGSSAARDVSDLILLKDSFAVLRPAFYEGRRIIGGMSSVLYLFLARVATTAMIIVAVTMIGLDFPFDPAQAALTTFTVGIPAFFLTLWAKPQKLAEGLLPSLAKFVVPAAMLTTLMGAGIYAIDHEVVLNSPLVRADIPNEFQETYENYTGITFGSEGTRTSSPPSRPRAASPSSSHGPPSSSSCSWSRPTGSFSDGARR
ncbi:HAD-IC family P-type ATPase [Rubrobacter marinus]|uniref:HAD-IC family P-type ATPase n=1 Tax=Rubrobacter marinus TaxID=2653852 RepID=UPI001A9F9321|nr:HAD-IC family P-type ATPase [Rubrobacter marinus]